MKIKSPGPVPKEALAFFRNKGIKPSFDYRDVWRAEHAATFTVAKAMQLDVLESIRGALDHAIENGTTLRQFKKDLTPTLQKLGWWGKKEMVDEATGEIVQAQLGSPRRLKTIYRANLRTARAAGQYERAQLTKKALPYFKYGLGPSKEHREEHVAFDGLILPVDHEFWQSHMPPNGWGCKCHVRQISQVEMDRRGLTVSEAPEIKMVPWENKRTGEIEWVPEGIDPGWDTNPGHERFAAVNKMMTDKLDVADRVVAKTAIKDLLQGPSFEFWLAKPQQSFPIAVVEKTAAEKIGAKVKVVRLSKETLAKQTKQHPEIKAAEYINVQDTIDKGIEIQDTATSLVYLLTDAKGYVSVVKSTKTGKALFLSSFRRLSKSQAKRDQEVQRLIKKGNQDKGR